MKKLVEVDLQDALTRDGNVLSQCRHLARPAQRHYFTFTQGVLRHASWPRRRCSRSDPVRRQDFYLLPRIGAAQDPRHITLG